MLSKISTRYLCANNQLFRTIIRATNSDIQRADEEIIDTSLIDKELREELSVPQNLIKRFNKDVSLYAPSLQPTFNFAAYIDQSVILQEFLKLGVNLSKLERKQGVPELLLRLDFERDVKKYLHFLNDNGVPAEKFGEFITKNPTIFTQDLDNLHLRVKYLNIKKFPADLIANILVKHPNWINFKTQEIDKKLGYFQNKFELSGGHIRRICWNLPKVITYNTHNLETNTFCIAEEMGFDKAEMKKLIVKAPKLWIISQKSLINRFDYLHKTMNISHKQLCEIPQVLYYRELRIKQRHSFLKSLNRAQYDSTKENYVPLYELVASDDVEFCTKFAKTSVNEYNLFLKCI